MGLFDFAKDAGHKIGLGDGSADTQKKAAAKKAAEVSAEAAKQLAEAEAKAKAAAAKAKSEKDAAAKASAEAEAKKAAEAAVKARAMADKAAADARAEIAKATELEAYVTKLGLAVTHLDIRVDDGNAFVSGQTPTAADKEKLVLAVGNVAGVSRVIDSLTVAPPAPAAAAPAAQAPVAAAAEPESQIYVVKSGDSLSKIAKQFYGDAGKYTVIFEANKPMLKDPDEIFPGQSLRIPA